MENKSNDTAARKKSAVKTARLSEREAAVRRNGRNFLFGLLRREFDASTDTWKVRPNLARCFSAALVAAVLFWIAAPGAMWLAYKYAGGFSTVSFTEILCSPFDRAKHRKAMGEFNIQEAKRLFVEQNYSSGFANLQKGVARSPDNLAARAALARIYISWFEKIDDAAEILDMKVSRAFAEKDSGYLSLAITFFGLSDEYRDKSASLVAACETSGIMTEGQLMKALTPVYKALHFKKQDADLAKFSEALADKIKDSDLLGFVGRNGAVAYMGIMDFAAAEKLLSKCKIYSGETYAFLDSRKKICEGDEIGAAKILSAMLKKSKNPAEVYRQLAFLHSNMGFGEASEDAKKMSEMSNGKGYYAEIDNIRNAYKDRKDTANDKLIDAYLKKYAARPEAVLPLMSMCVSQNWESGIEKCAASAAEKNGALKLSVGLFRVEHLIRNGRPQDALSRLNSVKKSVGSERLRNPPSFDGFELAIAALSGEQTKSKTENFVKNHSGDSGSIVSFANFMVDSKLYGVCEAVCEEARKYFPSDGRFPSLIAMTFLEKGDVAALSAYIAATGTRFPVKILAELPESFDGDAFVFISAADKSKLAKMGAEARAKKERYGKLFGL